MPLDLNGTTSTKAHHDFIVSFWLEFGVDGNKTHKSPRPKQETLERLKLIGDTVILRKNTPTKTKTGRYKFNKIKQSRHSLKSHKMCFACGDPADVRHHIIWIKHGGLNSKRNLISLCHNCHAYIHPWLQSK